MHIFYFHEYLQIQSEPKYIIIDYEVYQMPKLVEIPSLAVLQEIAKKDRDEINDYIDNMWMSRYCLEEINELDARAWQLEEGTLKQILSQFIFHRKERICQTDSQLNHILNLKTTRNSYSQEKYHYMAREEHQIQRDNISPLFIPQQVQKQYVEIIQKLGSDAFNYCEINIEFYFADIFKQRLNKYGLNYCQMKKQVLAKIHRQTFKAYQQRIIKQVQYVCKQNLRQFIWQLCKERKFKYKFLNACLGKMRQQSILRHYIFRSREYQRIKSYALDVSSQQNIHELANNTQLNGMCSKGFPSKKQMLYILKRQKKAQRIKKKVAQQLCFKSQINRFFILPKTVANFFRKKNNKGQIHTVKQPLIADQEYEIDK